MGKNIIIQEGGTPKSLSVDKLRTNTTTGGYMNWVPEEDVQLGIKYINKNGTYNASDDGYYGYSSVTVSGVGNAYGKDPDGSGDDAYASVDPETGMIEVQKLPASIRVVTPPTVTTYADGAAIDYSGMVVKGYTESGEVWTNRSHPDGVIPISELSLLVTHASKDEAVSYGVATSEYDQTPIRFAAPPIIEGGPTAEGKSAVVIEGGTAAAVLISAAYGYMGIVASSSPFIARHYELWGSDPTPHNVLENQAASYTLDGKTVYWGGWTVNPARLINVPVNAAVYNHPEWTMIYGNITRHDSEEKIPVRFTFPTYGGDKTLEDSFGITVT